MYSVGNRYNHIMFFADILKTAAVSNFSQFERRWFICIFVCFSFKYILSVLYLSCDTKYRSNIEAPQICNRFAEIGVKPHAAILMAITVLV